jgi:hypothetical protein
MDEAALLNINSSIRTDGGFAAAAQARAQAQGLAEVWWWSE